jgi:hypothetical protein
MIKVIARGLYAANESRAELTGEAATSETFGQLREYEAQISLANGHVEDQVRLIRSTLHLPPPTTS